MKLILRTFHSHLGKVVKAPTYTAGGETRSLACVSRYERFPQISTFHGLKFTRLWEILMTLGSLEGGLSDSYLGGDTEETCKPSMSATATPVYTLPGTRPSSSPKPDPPIIKCFPRAEEEPS